ncbi:helix-turn-helix domain-containing protein [Morganella morganii]|uniref:helix-turn-helix domain-containing protein n=1 Tax=Morganella morganii TaxID=582 RepID=UPI00339C3CA2
MKKINLDDNSLTLSCYIGGLLRDIRYNTGLSGYELGKKINLSQQQVSRYERGKTGFQLHILFRFFSALRMNEDDIQHFFYRVISKAGYIPQYEFCGTTKFLTDTDILFPGL